ncbi:unnamed protein product [Paramecium sonneborni]|uniref:Uncharacterized protein n=1 Tax=Paramecium sonneborni TaxID=65129 RepID=A0A8S1M8S4_9CILI|nr:unnamed protein product [Paramecium sonneborni]
MNQSLLHLIEIAKKHKNKFDEQYLDEMIVSSSQNAQNDRYLILLLIKIWKNNNEFLGYRFKQWVQKQPQFCNSKLPLDLLRNGQVHECIQNFEQKLSRNTFEAIKKHNFFPKHNSQQIEESFKRVKENLKQYDDPILNKINKILQGDLESIIEESKQDWISFIMLYVQFCDYKIVPQEMTEKLKQLNFSIEEDNSLMQLFGEIVLESENLQIIYSLLLYDKPLAYFVYLYFENQGQENFRSQQEINKSKFQLIKTILEKIPNDMQFENEVLYFFEEITGIVKFLKNSGNIDFEQKFFDIQKVKIKGIIDSSNNFSKIMNFVQQIEKFQQGQLSDIILETLLQKLFSQHLIPLENKENALNIIIERFLHDQNLIESIKKEINNQITNPYFDDLFKDLINNFQFQQYRGDFEQELIKLQFKYGLKLSDLQLTNEIQNPEFLIMNISQEFIRNVTQSDDSFKLKMKIILSNLLDQCGKTQDEKLNNRKNIIRLLIRRL